MRCAAKTLAGLAGALFWLTLPAGSQEIQPAEPPPPEAVPGEATGDGTETAQPARQLRPSPEQELATLMAAIADPAAGDWEKIEERIVELWSISGSDTADLLLRRGRDAMNAGDFVTAIGHFTALIENAPGFAEGWNARATAFFMLEEFGLALADIERTLAINPSHFGALAGLGIILEQSGQPATALAAFREAQRLNPHRPQVNEAVDRLVPLVDGTAL
jgi:tetratricopeptide (TPR) repeat protein